ncbi:MAG TPA: VOC family protein [Steroidobacteraceae bacterium]|nr:VOC family protein [Steroidobacteraceae bacterium]
MPVIKIANIAYGRMQSPDLDLAEQFLTDFGLVRVERTPRALYMRGTDAQHHVHITELGEPRYRSLAWRAQSYDDLVEISKLEGASGIESIDEPGGGKRVRIEDPTGYPVEIVHGMAELAPLPIARPHLNMGNESLRRQGELFRVPSGPSHVKRIGHAVIMTPEFERTVAWYRQTLGLLCSDETYRGEPTNIVGSFNRLDRGQEYVDHHVLYVMRGIKTGFNHISFEVQDLDDVLIGHEHLQARGYRPTWGVGRHALGSQIFDYWFDPWDRVHEHWTDSDRVNAQHPPGFGEAGIYTRGPWGPYPPTGGFATHASP